MDRDRNYNIPLCEETGKQCKPAKVDFCKCWFSCHDLAEFNERYDRVMRERELSKGQQ